MKKIFATVLFCAAALQVNAQDFTHSLGFRFASGPYDNVGIAYKVFVTKPGALEFDLGFANQKYHGEKFSSWSISGAYQHHFPIGDIKNFKWFVGGGLVVANTEEHHYNAGGTDVAIFPTGGVEYRLKNAPFVFSADLRPTFHLTNNYESDYHGHHHSHINNSFVNFGLTARYVF